MRLLIIVLISTFLLSACTAGFTSQGTPTPQPTSTATAGALAPTATPESTPESTEASPTETAEPPATVTPPAATTEPPTPTLPVGGGDLQQQLEQIEQDVVELRELELLADIDEQIISRDELRANLEVLLEEEYSREQAAIDILSYWLLRLVDDPNLDLYQLQLDLLSEQVAGYYDPETDELVLVSENDELSANDKVTMAHEIVHGLQDQHFDLEALDNATNNLDEAAALTALIEGDATRSMTGYAFDYLSEIELLELLLEAANPSFSTDVLDSAPRYISDGLVFSYDSGSIFVEELFSDGGLAAIDQAFSDPPLSTEQILHPEKYLAEDRDDPVTVTLPDLTESLGDGWEMTYSDTLGEWDFMIMLEENQAANARQAHEGWDGSRFDLYRSGSDSVMVLGTVSDSESDADEFLNSYLSTISDNATTGQVYPVDGMFIGVLAEGDSVTVVSGSNEGVVNNVLAMLA